MSDPFYKDLRGKLRRVYVDMAEIWLETRHDPRMQDKLLALDQILDEWFEHEWEEANRER